MVVEAVVNEIERTVSAAILSIPLSIFVFSFINLIRDKSIIVSAIIIGQKKVRISTYPGDRRQTIDKMHFALPVEFFSAHQGHKCFLKNTLCAERVGDESAFYMYRTKITLNYFQEREPSKTPCRTHSYKNNYLIIYCSERIKR